MVFEKKQLSKVLAIALMVACAVAFMPLLNGQVFAAKKPGKAKITSLEQADTANDDGTYAVTVAYKAKKAKKYQVSYTDGTEAKTMKTKKKSVSFNGTVDSTYTVKVRGIKGKKKGKWSAAQEIKVEAKTPGPTGKLEITGVTQNGAKQLKVSFGTTVDPAGLVFTVTKNGKEVTATAKADPSDPNSILLDLDGDIKDGDAIAVSVKTTAGSEVPTAAGAKTDVAGEAEKVTSIEVDENLVLTERKTGNESGATVTYKILNQFGEDITKNIPANQLNVTSSIGTAKQPISDLGTIEVENILDVQTIAGTEGTIVVVYTKTGLSTTATVKVGDPAKISEVSIKGIYSKKTKKEMAIIAKADTNKEAVFAFELKDQYGRDWKGEVNPASLDDGTKQNVTVSLIGGLTKINNVDSVGGITIDDVDYFTIVPAAADLEGAVAGDARLIIVANETGAKDEFTYTVGNENVIASLVITPPTQVIGGVENTFTVEAKNAAGEAITDYATLTESIKLPGSDGVDEPNKDASGTWSWKKLKDGTAQIILNAVPNKTTYNIPAVSIFSVIDNPTVVVPVSFDIIPGAGVPDAVTDITTKSTANSNVKITGIKVVDVFAEKVEPLDGYTLEITQSDYAENKSDATLINGEITVGKTKVEIPWNEFGEESGLHVAMNPNASVDSASARVVVTLLDSEGNKVSQFGKTISVAKDDVVTFDDYEIKVTSPAVEKGKKDLSEIYLGKAEKDAEAPGGYKWTDEPVTDEYAVEVYGIIGTTEFAIAPSDYVINDTADMLNGNTLEITPEDAAKAVASDTISLKVSTSGSKVVKEKTVTFSQEAPVATSFDLPEDPEEIHIPAYLSGNPGMIDASQIAYSLIEVTFDDDEDNPFYLCGVKDQYGMPFGIDPTKKEARIPAITVDQKAIEKEYLAKVKFNGGTNFSIEAVALVDKDGDGKDDNGRKSLEGETIYATVDYDGVSGEIAIEIDMD